MNPSRTPEIENFSSSPSKLKETPSLVVITGRPGSGKSTLAAEIGTRICCPVVSRDALKRVMLASRGPTYVPNRDDNLAANAEFVDAIQKDLANNQLVIAEAAFQQPAWESILQSLWSRASIQFIICDLDANSAAKRIAKRADDDPEFARIHPGPVTAIWIAPVFPVPTTVVDTSDGYEPSLDEIIFNIRK